MKISDGTIQDDNKPKDRLPTYVLVVLLFCCVAGIFFALNFNRGCANSKSPVSPLQMTNAYDSFDNGVSCGVDALMFFVRQGKKEIDLDEVHKKAQEIRKEKEKK